MKKLIYLDNAATTKTSEEVVAAMLPYFTEYYGNPSSVYEFASESKKAVSNARRTIAETLGAQENEIYFTAGGSEADNWALKATAEAYQSKGKHIITTKIEHHAILHTAEYLEKRGFEITYIGVDENGVVKVDELEKGVLFHTDAVQAYGQLPINVDELHIDMLSSSGHKLNGPKGIGFLYIRKGVKIRSFVHGGAQERKRRAGTENVPGIVGYGKAAEIAAKTMKERTAKEIELRDHLIDRVLAEVPYTRLNGHRTNRLPNNANFSFQFVEGESLPSHVLLAIGLPHEIAHGSLRLTLSAETTMEDIDFVVDCIKQIIERLRSMSPLYEDFVKKNQK